MNFKEHIKLPVLTIYDPCLICGNRVSGISVDTQYVKDNPEAVIMVGSSIVVNPTPNPMLDIVIPIGYTVTFHPCNHQTSGWELEERHWQVRQYT